MNLVKGDVLRGQTYTVANSERKLAAVLVSEGSLAGMGLVKLSGDGSLDVMDVVQKGGSISLVRTGIQKGRRSRRVISTVGKEGSGSGGGLGMAVVSEFGSG